MNIEDLRNFCRIFIELCIYSAVSVLRIYIRMCIFLPIRTQDLGMVETIGLFLAAVNAPRTTDPVSRTSNPPTSRPPTPDSEPDQEHISHIFLCRTRWFIKSLALVWLLLLLQLDARMQDASMPGFQDQPTHTSIHPRIHPHTHTHTHNTHSSILLVILINCVRCSHSYIYSCTHTPLHTHTHRLMYFSGH